MNLKTHAEHNLSLQQYHIICCIFKILYSHFWKILDRRIRAFKRIRSLESVRDRVRIPEKSLVLVRVRLMSAELCFGK